MIATRAALVLALGLAGCQGPPVASPSVPAVPAATPPAPVAVAPALDPLMEKLEQRYRAENDRICRRFHGVSCHALPHLLGPINATGLNEKLACVNGIVAVQVSGQWVPDLKYKDSKSGQRYGDGCIGMGI